VAQGKGGGQPKKPVTAKEVADMRKKGMSNKQIQEATGLSKGTVDNRLKEAGATRPTRGQPAKSSKQEVEQAQQDTGTVKGAAKRLGIGRSTAKRRKRGE
jgi:DNA invertase Pin-like site-specific DNA recombinase